MRKLILGIVLAVAGIVFIVILFHPHRAEVVQYAVQMMPPTPDISETKALAAEAPKDRFDQVLNYIQKIISIVSTGFGSYITFIELKKKLTKKPRKAKK